ncbi:MAG: Xaa-Pro peptidase family protein [Candidatus Bathyarchaeia archaeon]
MVRDEVKLKRVWEMMRTEGLAALVLRLPENVTYLSDAWSGRGLSYLVFPLERDPVLIHPVGETLPPTWVSDVRLYKWETFEHLGSALNVGPEQVLKALTDIGIGSGAIGVEEAWEFILSSPLRYELNVIGQKTLTALRAKLKEYELKDASGLLTQARSIKTVKEVKALKKANRIARIGLETFERYLKPGLTEIELSTKIEHEIVTRGVMEHRANRVVACAFVVSGPSTSEAYKYVVGNTRRKLKHGDLALLELDVVADGYSSDTTRTFVVGKPNKKQTSLLEAVLDSESTAIASIKPGVSAAKIARVSIDVIRRHGLGEYLVHRLGHGIGVGVHEPIPALHVESSDFLKPGMVHSVEPGVYGPKIGGIRIEDDILDTEKGTEYLSNFPRIQE